MSWDSPRLLWLLLFLPVPLLMARSRLSRSLPGYFALLGPASHDRSRRMATEIRHRAILSSWCFTACFACAVLALAGPRWGERLVRESRQGVDCMIALDLSRSMLARDIAPSRLEKAAFLSRDIVEAFPGLRFGVALGKGSGILALPLTEDSESTVALLSSVSSDSLSATGTDLENLLDAARKGFQNSLATNRVILLLSDGETLSGSLNQAADRAAAAGIAIAAVGVGTEAGSSVPVSPRSRDKLKNADGAEVVSSLRSGALRSAAARTGGMYLDISETDSLESLVSWIDDRAEASASSGFRREPVPRFSLFLVLSLLFLTLGKWVESGFRGRI